MPFDFIKNLLSKNQNTLRIFLIFGFLLAEFLVSPVPVIASKTSIINRHIALNGVEVWPVNIIFMCQQYFDSPPLGGYPTCEQGITANNNFTVALGHNKIDNGNLAFWQMAMPKYTAAGKWFSTMTEGGNGGSSLLSNSLFINNVKNQPYFYGYELENEERSLWGQTDEALINRYNYYHSGDPNHIVYYFDFAYTGTGGHNVSEFSDVWGFSTFIHHTQPYFPVEDFIFARESQIIERPPFFTRLDDKPIPIMLTMEQVGQPINVCGGTCLPLTKKELRAHAYWGVTTNVAGLNFWSYKGAEDPHVSSSIYGTVSNPTTVKEMNDLAGDLTNSWMQHVLVSPTLNYSWNEEAPDNRVTFSKTACKFLSAYSGKCRSSFSYILKQYNGEYILIVPNKNKNQIADVQITIQGLTGDMTATTYSTYNTEDSSNNGRSIPVHNGVFTDTFDGYAAHVYRICSGTCPPLPSGGTDATPPTVIISCPANGTPYNVPNINITGTATDNESAVTKVEYKIDSGPWQNVPSGTTSWNIPNMPINTTPDGVTTTIQIRAINTAGLTSTSVSVTVKYDASGGTGTSTPPLWANGFENNQAWNSPTTISPWGTSCTGDGDFNDFSRVTNPVREGSYAAKFRVNGASTCGGTTGSRFEVLSSEYTDPTSEREGNEFWYSLSMMLDPSWTSLAGDTTYHIFTQWHGPTTLSPELALSIINKNGNPTLTYGMCTGNSPERPTPTSNCAYRQTTTIINPLEKGVWYDFMVHVKWTVSSAGVMEIWGKKSTETAYAQLANLINVPTLQKITGYTPMVASRHIGLYRSGGYTDTDILYIDDYKMGTTQESVTGGTSSTPLCSISPLPCTSTGCGGACPDPQGTSCNDGNSCTENETCQAGGTCGGGTPKSCPNSNQCQIASCNPANNGACDIIANRSGSCNADNNLCTVGDYCSNGECKSGFNKDCSGNVCTDNTCNPSTGNCNPINNDKPCDSSSLCDTPGSGKCSNGICSGTPKSCDDGQACTIDFCNPENGNCSSSNVCGGLVPCGRLVDNPATPDINEQAPCTVCSLFYMAKQLINFAAKLSFALAVLSLVIAGLLYATSAGNNQAIDLAKRAVYYTIIGMFIVFLAWLLIAVLLKALGYADITVWNQVNCVMN